VAKGEVAPADESIDLIPKKSRPAATVKGHPRCLPCRPQTRGPIRPSTMPSLHRLTALPTFRPVPAGRRASAADTAPSPADRRNAAADRRCLRISLTAPSSGYYLTAFSIAIHRAEAGDIGKPPGDL
jgi:hypothetical protein